MCAPLRAPTGNLGGPVPLPQARVWIHVADPTRWLSPASSQVLMEEAKARLRTLYFPWGFVPMFPRALAEGVFSLREGRECDALSICAEVGDDGAIGAVSVVPSRVRVTRKLSYDEADAILGRPHHSHDTVGGCVGDADYEPAETDGNASRRQVAVDLSMLQAVSQARRAMRLRQGAMDVMLPEARVEVPPSDLDAENPRVTIRRICQWVSVGGAGNAFPCMCVWATHLMFGPTCDNSRMRHTHSLSADPLPFPLVISF